MLECQVESGKGGVDEIGEWVSGWVVCLERPSHPSVMGTLWILFNLYA